MRVSFLLPLLLAIAACGGSVATVPDDGSSGGSGHASNPPPIPTTPTTPATPPPPTDGPWGVWRMTGLDGPPGVPANEPAPAMQLELRRDGTAWRSRCTDSKQESCPFAYTYECYAGTVTWDGAQWRVDIPNIRVGNVPEQGEIVKEPDDGILVRYINPTYSAGHFRKVDDGYGACAK